MAIKHPTTIGICVTVGTRGEYVNGTLVRTPEEYERELKRIDEINEEIKREWEEERNIINQKLGL